MAEIDKKIVVDEAGNPQAVIIPWGQFCELMEQLGLDLDAEAAADLKAAREDYLRGDSSAFTPLADL